MAARGAEAKEVVKAKIFEVFEGAFVASDGKTIRVPITEGTEVVEIKIALTAAKDIEGSGSAAAPAKGNDCAWTDEPVVQNRPVAPSQSEIDNVNKLAAMLGF